MTGGISSQIARKQRPAIKKKTSATMVSVEEYKNDPLYPRVVRAVTPLLAHGKVVAPVDVLVGMGILEKSKLEDWRFGRAKVSPRCLALPITDLAPQRLEDCQDFGKSHLRTRVTRTRGV